LITRMSASRATLYEMFTANVLAREGTVVLNREEAEVEFTIAEDGDVSPFDIAKITSEWL
jgi:hypothetical protein